MALPLSITARASLLLCIGLASCTNGGINPTASGAQSVTHVTRINVSIAAYPLQSTPAGDALGYSPIITNVPVGSGVQFVNVDNAPHTATSLGNVSTFPAASPFSFTATTPSTSTILSSGSWSAGALQPGDVSQIFLVDKPGVYLYGCFFHYGGRMRGEIVAQ